MLDGLAKNVANVLSVLTILSCVFLKIPQIMSVRERQSAEGIYIQAMLMEIIGFSIMTLYNYTNRYCIMTYMEYPLILIQVYILFYYVLMYKDLLCSPIVPIATIMYVTAVLGFISEFIPKSILSFLVPFCSPLSSFAKVTYIYGIIKAQNADAVSLTTWIISVATNLARIFTIYVDSADAKLMTNFIISTVLSSAVLGTAIHYKSINYPQQGRIRRTRRKSSSRRRSSFSN